MDPKQMTQLIRQHTDAEVRLDIDAVMATVCDDPFYEIQPLGYLISGRDAVRTYYERALPIFKRLKPGPVPSGSFGGGQSTDYVGNRGLVIRDDAVFEAEDGVRIRIKALSLLVVDEASGLLKGEHIYVNAAMGRLFQEALGHDFVYQPGVAVENWRTGEDGRITRVGGDGWSGAMV
jgi:hypothetical protein